MLGRLDPELARPEALLGYEAMSVVLDAIRAGGPDRERVRRAGTRTRTRESPLGGYLLRATGDVDSTELRALDPARRALRVRAHGRLNGQIFPALRVARAAATRSGAGA